MVISLATRLSDAARLDAMNDFPLLGVGEVMPMTWHPYSLILFLSALRKNLNGRALISVS